MSSRLIGFVLLIISGSALAQTETTTEVVEESAETATQAVEQASDAATEAVGEAVETTVENTEQAVEEMTEAVTEEIGAVSEKTEEASGESVEATETAIEEVVPAGVEVKIAACAACHGSDGNSIIPQNPKLAGQVPGFIADQLAKFKSGDRENAIMASQVMNLTEDDMKEIDAYFSAQQPQLGSISEDMQEMALQGEKIFRGGEISMSISACMSCHGPSGRGIPIRFPRVSGQHIEYLEQQLLAYKSGSRVSEIMNPIAFRLSEQQIKALATYMHGLK